MERNLQVPKAAVGTTIREIQSCVEAAEDISMCLDLLRTRFV